MKTGILLGWLLASLFLAGCDIGEGNGDSDTHLRLNIRVVAETADDLENLKKITDALELRGLTATLLLTADFVQANCEQVQAFQEAGFEIMAYAPAQKIDGQSVTLSMLSEQEQTDYLQAIKDAFDACLAIPVEGFGSAGFDQNESTWGIVEALGYTYNLGFLAHTIRNLPGHEGAFLPYQSEAYAFWAVPMCAAYINKQWFPLSDAYFVNQLDAAGWETLLKDQQLNLMINLNRPLMIEVHAQHTGADDAWLDALMNIIAEARQKEAVFVSVKELVEWSETQYCAPCQQKHRLTTP